jgi:hypothetical protein
MLHVRFADPFFASRNFICSKHALLELLRGEKKSEKGVKEREKKEDDLAMKQATRKPTEIQGVTAKREKPYALVGINL